jgi:hypothetical protein
MPESGMMELTAMEAGAGRDGTWRMEAAGGPEVTNSAVEASAASEVPTTVKSAAASEMSATAPMSTAPCPPPRAEAAAPGAKVAQRAITPSNFSRSIVFLQLHDVGHVSTFAGHSLARDLPTTPCLPDARSPSFQ